MLRGVKITERAVSLALKVLALSFILSVTVLAGGAASPPKAAPIPQSARGPAIPQDKGYLVQEIKDGLYWVTDGVYQTMFLVTGKGVIAVDAPPTIGKNYLKAIAEVTKEPVTHVIYSHAHKDHIGSASMFPRNARYIAHTETARLLARANDPDRPVPTVTFTSTLTLKVGRQTLILDYRGPNHVPGNIFIYAPRQKVLMLVDVIFPGWVPFTRLAVSQDIPGYIAAHKQVLSYDFNTFIGGHLTRLGTREDVKVQIEYMDDVKANAAKALQTVDFMAIAKETGFENPWLLFARYLDAAAKACADATVPKWVNRLGGADVYTFDHCWTMQESLRVD